MLALKGRLETQAPLGLRVLMDLMDSEVLADLLVPLDPRGLPARQAALGLPAPSALLAPLGPLDLREGKEKMERKVDLDFL